MSVNLYELPVTKESNGWQLREGPVGLITVPRHDWWSNLLRLFGVNRTETVEGWGSVWVKPIDREHAHVWMAQVHGQPPKA